MPAGAITGNAPGSLMSAMKCGTTGDSGVTAWTIANANAISLDYERKSEMSMSHDTACRIVLTTSTKRW